jgi:hypothetical protein
MHLDVIDLRQFYYRTRLGRIAQKAIRDQMLTFWPEAKGQTVVGFGFAVPLLRPYLADARRVVGLMPAEQGVMPWPSGSTTCRSSAARALAAGDGPCRQAGVPARAGDLGTPRGGAAGMLPRAGAGGAGAVHRAQPGRHVGAADKTPFGFGRPYTLGQLEAQLKRHDFVPERHCAALFSPPSDKRFWLKSADMLESLGSRLPGQRVRRRVDRGGVETGLRAAGPGPGGARQATVEGAGGRAAARGGRGSSIGLRMRRSAEERGDLGHVAVGDHMGRFRLARIVGDDGLAVSRRNAPRTGQGRPRPASAGHGPP